MHGMCALATVEPLIEDLSSDKGTAKDTMQCTTCIINLWEEDNLPTEQKWLVLYSELSSIVVNTVNSKKHLSTKVKNLHVQGFTVPSLAVHTVYL